MAEPYGRSLTTDQEHSLNTLLERHGVIQDLRAHLRSHLVALVKQDKNLSNQLSAELSQKSELRYQAINLLIAEHLLLEECKQTLSAFSSEISIHGMVFHFTQSDLVNLEGRTLRIDQNDTWLILHSLGMCCKSKQAQTIIEAYKNDSKPSLLLCLLMSLQFSESSNSTEPDAKVVCSNFDLSNNYCDHNNKCDFCMLQKYKDRQLAYELNKKLEAKKQQIRKMNEEHLALMAELDATKSAFENLTRISRQVDRSSESFNHRHSARDSFRRNEHSKISLNDEPANDRVIKQIVYSDGKLNESPLRDYFAASEQNFLVNNSSELINRNGSPTDEIVASAKMRLKKLKIEADVVEQSYREFRSRQKMEVEKISCQIKGTIPETSKGEVGSVRDLCRTFQNKLEHINGGCYHKQNVTKINFDHNNSNPSNGRHHNVYSTTCQNDRIAQFLAENRKTPKTNSKPPINYLEQPLSEFRKLYRSNTSKIPSYSGNKFPNVPRNSKVCKKESISNRYRNYVDAATVSQNCSQTDNSKKLTPEQITSLQHKIRKFYGLPDEVEKRQRYEKFWEATSVSKYFDKNENISQQCTAFENSEINIPSETHERQFMFDEQIKMYSDAVTVNKFDSNDPKSNNLNVDKNNWSQETLHTNKNSDIDMSKNPINYTSKTSAASLSLHHKSEKPTNKTEKSPINASSEQNTIIDKIITENILHRNNFIESGNNKYKPDTFNLTEKQIQIMLKQFEPEDSPTTCEKQIELEVLTEFTIDANVIEKYTKNSTDDMKNNEVIKKVSDNSKVDLTDIEKLYDPDNIVQNNQIKEINPQSERNIDDGKNLEATKNNVDYQKEKLPSSEKSNEQKTFEDIEIFTNIDINITKDKEEKSEYSEDFSNDSKENGDLNSVLSTMKSEPEQEFD